MLLTRQGGSGWKKINDEIELEGHPKKENNFTTEFLMMFIAVFTVYGGLFSFDFWLYGNVFSVVVATVLAIIGVGVLFKYEL